MNIYVPFICLTLGAVINWRGLPQSVLKVFDIATNVALILLMLVIGLNIGTSKEVMSNLGQIGLNCLIISLSAIGCSVLLVRICEATVMPLEKIRLQVAAENEIDAASADDRKFSPLVVIMPGCIIAGIVMGCTLLCHMNGSILGTTLTISLIFLYTGVGVSLGSNKGVFQYIKKLGFRILFMPLAIFAGCVLGGIISGLVLDVPLSWSAVSAGGMGYYSLTGAFLTESFGVEAGTYGFVVNVSRDVFTVILLPLLTKISKGSPIASGAAGCMDTMLVPVTGAVGPELGMVARISGTILTFLVPLWLPLGVSLFS